MNTRHQSVITRYGAKLVRAHLDVLRAELQHERTPRAEQAKVLARARTFLNQTLSSLAVDVDTYLRTQAQEIDIITQRLNRRFDPGAALNEAMERAIAAKKADPNYVPPLDPAMPSTYADAKAAGIRLDGSDDSWARLAKVSPPVHDGAELTPRQKAALDIQAQQAKQRIDRA